MVDKKLGTATAFHIFSKVHNLFWFDASPPLSSLLPSSRSFHFSLTLFSFTLFSLSPLLSYPLLALSTCFYLLIISYPLLFYHLLYYPLLALSSSLLPSYHLLPPSLFPSSLFQLIVAKQEMGETFRTEMQTNGRSMAATALDLALDLLLKNEVLDTTGLRVLRYVYYSTLPQ